MSAGLFLHYFPKISRQQRFNTITDTIQYKHYCHAVQLLSSGADGLVKLWSVRTTECLNTFDGHDDKVPHAPPAM